MKKENTKYQKNYNIPLTILSSIFLMFIILILIHFLKSANNFVEIAIFSFLLVFIFVGLIGGLKGIIKAKSQISKKNKDIKKTNPYIYYRELPNNYGIGVTSLLFDSTIENYKDIIAIILDLCARKYLTLIKQNDKYLIKILNPVDNNLLNNEKYILNLIINNDIKNINYQEWYNYCMQDGIDLGLYYHIDNIPNNKPLLTEDILKKRRKVHLIISTVFASIIFILFIFNKNYTNIQSSGYAVISFITTYIILIIPFWIFNMSTVIKNVGKHTSDLNYKNMMNNQLTRTQKGIDELHKLYSFKAFIKEFGHFVDKKPEEVVLWDRYLSYAQVFDLTKEIMNTGYKELIDNSSFQIDNIDNINLYNIETN